MRLVGEKSSSKLALTTSVDVLVSWCKVSQQLCSPEDVSESLFHQCLSQWRQTYDRRVKDDPAWHFGWQTSIHQYPISLLKSTSHSHTIVEAAEAPWQWGRLPRGFWTLWKAFISRVFHFCNDLMFLYIIQSSTHDWTVCLLNKYIKNRFSFASGVCVCSSDIPAESN